MVYTLLRNGRLYCFELDDENGEPLKYVPLDPCNADYQRIKEDYESLEVKPFEFNF